MLAKFVMAYLKKNPGKTLNVTRICKKHRFSWSGEEIVASKQMEREVVESAPASNYFRPSFLLVSISLFIAFYAFKADFFLGKAKLLCTILYYLPIDLEAGTEWPQSLYLESHLVSNNHSQF